MQIFTLIQVQTNIFINNNCFTKIQKKYIVKNKNKIKMLNKNLNKPNNNKYNSNIRLIDIDLRKNMKITTLITKYYLIILILR